VPTKAAEPNLLGRPPQPIFVNGWPWSVLAVVCFLGVRVFLFFLGFLGYFDFPTRAFITHYKVPLYQSTITGTVATPINANKKERYGCGRRTAVDDRRQATTMAAGRPSKQSMEEGFSSIGRSE